MKLIILGDEKLRQISEPVTEFDETLKETVAEMFKVMKRSDGVGLAAPQVGINKRFFVVKIDDGIERIFINPEIIQTSPELCTSEEGCLSVPKFYAEVVRTEKITVQFFDLQGKPHTIQASGLLSRVIQHETDHLNGILFIDRISPEKRAQAEALIEKQKASILSKLKRKVRG
ncbi:MAG: peptide deformylase [Spirochaetaceae bacterium]|nr:peptide deformylase [Spirochaetaceae bacterium]